MLVQAILNTIVQRGPCLSSYFMQLYVFAFVDGCTATMMLCMLKHYKAALALGTWTDIVMSAASFALQACAILRQA